MKNASLSAFTWAPGRGLSLAVPRLFIRSQPKALYNQFGERENDFRRARSNETESIAVSLRK